MTFAKLLGSAQCYPDCKLFIAQYVSWPTERLLSPEEDAAERARLSDVWTAAHISVKEIRQRLGLTQAEFAERFAIPRRTIQSWEAAGGPSARECPRYLIALLAQAAGIVDLF